MAAGDEEGGVCDGLDVVGGRGRGEVVDWEGGGKRVGEELEV